MRLCGYEVETSDGQGSFFVGLREILYDMAIQLDSAEDELMTLREKVKEEASGRSSAKKTPEAHEGNP